MGMGWEDFASRGNWFGGRQRMPRGDMATIILHVLREKPMHGYEIIRTLEERSHGFWRPSAGSIYPTLQLLEEQGLVTSEEVDGKKVYSLTEEGKKPCGDGSHRPCSPWAERQEMGERFRQLTTTFRRIFPSLKDIAFSGSETDVRKAREILDTAGEALEVLAKTISSK